MNSKNILFIPMYNCEKQIVRMLEKIVLLELSFVDEMIFIDNCSSDGTSIAVSKFKNLSDISSAVNVKLIQNNINFGLGGSFKIAVNYAKENGFSSMIWLHGDDQADVNDISRIWDHYKQTQTKCVFGARFMNQSNLDNYSKIRTYGNKVLNKLYKIFLGTEIHELGSGLNVYDVKAIYDSSINKWPMHIAFDLNLLFLFIKKQNQYEWFPINWSEDDQESNANNIIVGIQILFYLFYFLITKKMILKKSYLPTDFSVRKL